MSNGTLRKGYLCQAARIISSSSGTLERAQFFRHCKLLTKFDVLHQVDVGRLRHQHKNTVQALAWSPNGNMVASASRDQTVRVFDIRAMKEFRVLKGHKKEVCCE